MIEADLLLGSNLGDRLFLLKRAVRELGRNVGKVVKGSSVYETEPWGNVTGNWFLNGVVRLVTSLSPYELLLAVNGIEQELGRIRDSQKVYQPRSMDIDILFYGDRIIRHDHLIIPHPLLHERRFALVPLCEIDPGRVHPVFRQTMDTLLAQCRDNLKLRIYRNYEDLIGN